MAEPGGSTEAARVERAMRGDREALRALWRDHRRWVAVVLLAHMPRDAELEDLLQDVALKMITGIGALRDGSSFRPWLRLIAVNTARSAGRRRTRRARLLKQAAVAGAPRSDSAGFDGDRDGDAEEGRRLLALASRLDVAYREPLLLRCVRGMSHRQIGELLDLPETTVETRIARGRRKLRELADPPEAAAPAALRTEKPEPMRATLHG